MSEWKLTKDRDGWYISPIGALIPFTDTHGGNAERQEASARKMAAAPKLLETVQWSLSYLSNINAIEPSELAVKCINAMREAGIAAPDIAEIAGAAASQMGGIATDLAERCHEMLDVVDPESEQTGGYYGLDVRIKKILSRLSEAESGRCIAEARVKELESAIAAAKGGAK